MSDQRPTSKKEHPTDCGHGHPHKHGEDHGHDLRPGSADAHGHADALDHSHGHSHGHAHGLGAGHHHVSDFGKAFAIGIVLNLLFVIIEALYGLSSHSLALLSDAGHNLSDVLGLALAWFATWLAKRRPSSQFTYGLRSSSILAAVINAVILLVAVGGIIWEAVLRFRNPAPVEPSVVMWVAFIGLLINGFTALLFASGSKSDLNLRGAFLHMVADAMVSLGVVVAGFLMLKTGLTWIDPVVSLTIGAVIIWGTWGLLKDSVSLALAGVPGGIDKEHVERFLMSYDEVSRVHDLHIWALSTSQTALTAHIVRAAANSQIAFCSNSVDVWARNSTSATSRFKWNEETTPDSSAPWIPEAVSKASRKRNHSVELLGELPSEGFRRQHLFILMSCRTRPNAGLQFAHLFRRTDDGFVQIFFDDSLQIGRAAGRCRYESPIVHAVFAYVERQSRSSFTRGGATFRVGQSGRRSERRCDRRRSNKTNQLPRLQRRSLN